MKQYFCQCVICMLSSYSQDLQALPVPQELWHTLNKCNFKEYHDGTLPNFHWQVIPRSNPLSVGDMRICDGLCRVDICPTQCGLCCELILTIANTNLNVTGGNSETTLFPEELKLINLFNVSSERSMQIMLAELMNRQYGSDFEWFQTACARHIILVSVWQCRLGSSSLEKDPLLLLV